MINVTKLKGLEFKYESKYGGVVIGIIESAWVAYEGNFQIILGCELPNDVDLKRNPEILFGVIKGSPEKEYCMICGLNR